VSESFWGPILASVVGVRAQGAFGSGWVATASGLVVTNHHVVGYLQRVGLRRAGMPEIAARVIYADAKLDLAVLLPDTPLEIVPVPLGDSRSVERGEPVVAIGHPLGFDYTVTRGIISATGRLQRGVEYLQTDASLNPGNSGGPLIDRRGSAIGVNSWIRSDGSGLGFALPVHVFAERLAALDAQGPALAQAVPRYGCAECEAIIDPARDRCASCGALIPFLHRSVLEAPERARSERAAAALIAALGFSPNAAAIGDGMWRLRTRTADLVFEIDPAGKAVRVAARLVEVPTADVEPCLRFLASANDRATGPARFSLVRSVVHLEWRDPIEGFDVELSKQRLLELAAKARVFQSILSQKFGAPPAPIELDGRGAR
jgi:serine protease Do